MRNLCRGNFAIAVLAIFLPGLLYGQNQPPQHPLDALKSHEYWDVYDVLRDSGKMDADTITTSVLLHEPAKDRVLAWKPGDPVFREAEVILLRKGIAIEALVDISAHKLESWKERKDVRAPIVDSEHHAIEELIKKDPRVVEALKKRGITDLAPVECFGDPFGYFALPELEGHRIVRGECADTHGVYLPWGRGIEGLWIEVDATEKKVLKVVDEGPIPVPQTPINYQDLPTLARPGTTPIAVSQPLGPSFQIKGAEVSWQNWRFRFRLDPRLGAIINLVEIQDGDRFRSVLYEGSFSELFVPYMDPATGWATRVFIDAGEFYHSGVLKPLRPDVDCPSNATYIDGLASDDHGFPVLHSRLACLFESYSGDPAWRHFEQHELLGSPARVLVLRTAAVIGNYDYVLDWRFERDGNLRVAVGATGIIETKGVKAKNASDSRGAHSMPGAPDEFGHFVAENTIGVNHDHFFSFRLDVDVDGVNNSFMADKLVRRELKNPARKSIWVVEPFIAKTEKDAMMDIHLEKPAMWHFINPNVKGPLGYPTGYELMPGTTAASLLDPDDGPQKVGAFSTHQLWVTPYKVDERFASGVYPTASKGTDDGLAIWTKANRPIENIDIVAWYTLGFHHVPRAEDWPVMPVMWHDFVLRPFDFFPQSPVLTLPPTP
jgi:primary-amine oxidase